MHSYLIFNHTYTTFEVGLFVNNILHDQFSHDSRLTSKLLIPLLNTMLIDNAITFSQLSFIGINQGPGLFSTLRAILATSNALHFATSIPLIGIDALDATLLEYEHQSTPYTVLLLNAFNKEVYYAISCPDKSVTKGYEKIETFLHTLSQTIPSQHINFIGSGTTMYADLINTICSANAIIAPNAPQLCSLSTIARLSLKKFIEKKETNNYLLPLYLKKHPVETQ